jgi:hypothetical protein
MNNASPQLQTKYTSTKLLLNILKELHLLRKELTMLFPTENLGGYAHPDRIKKSYRKATKQYPPAFIWK